LFHNFIFIIYDLIQLFIFNSNFIEFPDLIIFLTHLYLLI
jgi:hypothetical protein